MSLEPKKKDYLVNPIDIDTLRNLTNIHGIDAFEAVSLWNAGYTVQQIIDVANLLKELKK